MTPSRSPPSPNTAISPRQTAVARPSVRRALKEAGLQREAEARRSRRPRRRWWARTEAYSRRVSSQAESARNRGSRRAAGRYAERGFGAISLSVTTSARPRGSSRPRRTIAANVRELLRGTSRPCWRLSPCRAAANEEARFGALSVFARETLEQLRQPRLHVVETERGDLPVGATQALAVRAPS